MSLPKIFSVQSGRILLVVVTLSSCVSISLSYSWKTVFGVICLAGTYLVSWLSKRDVKRFSSPNPYKGKKGEGFLTEETEVKINKLIADSVVYDASDVDSLRRFNSVKLQTECIFAKKAKLWGSMDFDTAISIERNTERLIPTFYKFTLAFQDLGLDAFLIELPGDIYGSDIETFSAAVRRVLLTLRLADVTRQQTQLAAQAHQLDPADVENRQRYLVPDDPRTWGRASWVFEFNKITFFITTFAPFYPESNSRFGFGARHCYILFQPEISFAIHDLPPDTAETNWNKPVSVRDKIRVAFREAGREYQPPIATQLTMICDIVKPAEPYDPLVEWWKDSS